MNKIISLLQLFCEDHNFDLQSYIKKQTNSRHNYNLVNNVIDLLGVYSKPVIKCRGFFQHTLTCIKTLSEFVQGPCRANQKVLIEGKFLDFAQAILEDSIKKDAVHN